MMLSNIFYITSVLVLLALDGALGAAPTSAPTVHDECRFCPDNLYTEATYGPTSSRNNWLVEDGGVTCNEAYTQGVVNYERCQFIIANYRDVCCSQGEGTQAPQSSPSPSPTISPTFFDGIEGPTASPSYAPSDSPTKKSGKRDRGLAIRSNIRGGRRMRS